MKRLVLAAVAYLALSPFAHLSGQTATPSNDRDEILRLNRELADAFARRDADALNRILADDYTIVSPRGRLMTRDVYVGNRVGSGAFTESALKFDQVAVRLYGTTAIVTSLFTTQTASSGQPTRPQQDSREFVNRDLGACSQTEGGNTRTDTWIKQNGRWQMVATQLSPISFPGAREASTGPTMCGINADDLQWIDTPTFPGARVVVLSGNVFNGPYAVRMQRPDGHIEQPHRHESDESVSVTSGIVHIGLGDRVDRASAKVFHTGAYIVIPARTVHYSWAEGTVVEEISWNGPAAPVATHREVTLPPASLIRFAGVYRFAPDARTMTITLEGDQLMAQLSGAPARFPIYAESETMFFLKTAPPGSSVGVNERIEFSRSPSGNVTGLVFHGGQGDRTATRVSQ